MPFYIVFKHFELPTFMKCAILINLPCLTSNTLTKRLQDPIVRFGGAIALSVHLGSALFHYIREILGKQKNQCIHQVALDGLGKKLLFL